MKRTLIGIPLAVVALLAAGFAVLWNSPSLQDGLMARITLEQIRHDNSALLKDGALHIVLCGTGSPCPTRPERAPAPRSWRPAISF